VINTVDKLRRGIKVRALLLSLSLLLTPVALADYSDHPQAEALIDRVAARGVDREWLGRTLSSANRQESILKAISRPAEKSKPWADYQDIFLTDQRTKEGVAFWSKYEESLNQVSASTGVPAEVIVAIIGVETYYGRIMGSYRVIDALSTLAFDYPRRSKFFTKELEVFLELAWASDLSIDTMKGSYAGAMGLGQFMPSSYRAYAKDFDGDEVIDIWANPGDAIASVANYFVKHGWRSGGSVVAKASFADGREAAIFDQGLKPVKTIDQLQSAGLVPQTAIAGDVLATPIAFEGKQGDEYWLGLHNFYVITRYNHSAMYAMAVLQLSEALRAARL
tara:strand:+ start:4020 stop:5024 length:1005 start_codon:yes stop_codon:yes gene_type:complete